MQSRDKHIHAIVEGGEHCRRAWLDKGAKWHLWLFYPVRDVRHYNKALSLALNTVWILQYEYRAAKPLFIHLV